MNRDSVMQMLSTRVSRCEQYAAERSEILRQRADQIIIAAERLLIESEEALMHPDSPRLRNRAMAALGVMREALNCGCMLPTNFEAYLNDKVSKAKHVKLPSQM